MPENVYTYLKFVRYRELENWSVSHILGMNMGFNEMYPMISIGNVIERSVNAINIEDDISYKQITLKTNGGGAVLRDVKQGKSIGTKKQFVVSAGQFIMSKIDARNGAFGVVGTDLDGAVVTADFPVFDVVKDKVTPEYLALISSTAPFVKFAQSCSRGTTNRQRIDVGLFLSQKIPLPSIDEQRTLVSVYNDKITQSETLEKQAAQVEQEIEDYLLSELGIKQKGYTQAEPAATIASEPQVEYVVSNRQLEDRTDTYHWGDEIKKEYKYLKFVRFKDVERWDCYNEESSFLKKLKVSPFPIVEIGNVYDFIQRRWDKKGSKFNYVEIGSVDPLKGILYAEEIPTDKAPSRATQKINKGDLIIGTTRPCLKKFAIVNEDYDGCICSSGFQVVAPQNKYNLSYLCEVLKISVVISQFESFMSGALYPAITNKDLKKIQIPLPPIDIQNSIVEHINKQKEQIKQMKHQAEKLRKEALEDFEKEIFE